MNIAVLLRGFHFLRRDRFGYPLDARKCLPSLETDLLGPLRREHSLKLFFATYPSPLLSELTQRLRPEATVLLDSKTDNQGSTFCRGLELVLNHRERFDRIICTRFDLKYLKPVSAWNIWKQSPGVFFPWKEYQQLWEAERRVGDAIHVIDGEYAKAFRDALIPSPAQPRRDLHNLHTLLTPVTPNLYFIEDGYYDSNSLYCNRECRNPLYRIGNRPRLPVFQTSRPHLNIPSKLPKPLRVLKRKSHRLWEVTTIAVTSAMARLTANLPAEGKSEG